jgi:putative transposase
MIIKTSETKPLTKSGMAIEQGISRASLYYQVIKPQKDWQLKNQIERVLSDNPSYGHRRIAWELKINKKRALRVMRLFGIKPYRRRTRKYRKTKDYSAIYPNLLQQMPFPDKANQIWVSDFTYLSFHGKWIYLATIMDLFDRKIVGWSLLTSHTAQLTTSALIDAVEKSELPDIIHSDQGREYTARIYIHFAENINIRISMSHKGCPWENGHQESFYSQFKVDLGDPNRFKTLGELAVAVYQQIYYYNNLRIHTKLKMPPVQYSEQRRQLLTINPAPVIL